MNIRVVDGETVVFDRREELIHQLNLTAGYIWDRCDGKSSVVKITNQFAKAFDVDSKTAGKDVDAIVLQLRSLNLLETAGGRVYSELWGNYRSSKED